MAVDVYKRQALCIPYEINGEIKPTYPDFIIVREDERLGYVIDILEPHLSLIHILSSPATWTHT